jgi:hypothetical protein
MTKLGLGRKIELGNAIPFAQDTGHLPSQRLAWFSIVLSAWTSSIQYGTSEGVVATELRI